MWKKEIQNLHVHTLFCDGQDSPEDLVREAIALGMEGIGFSAHASTAPFSPDGCLPLSKEADYKAEILRLKKKYEHQLRIYLGLEFDMYSQCDPTGYEYMIGACHFIRIGDTIVNYDEGTPESTQRVIDTWFGGDGLALAEQYYEDFTRITTLQSIDIIGHFDIIRSYCRKYHLFDDDSRRYRNAAIESLRTLARKVPAFELNMSPIVSDPGAIPFPAPFLLKELRSMGGAVVITNDCHTRKYLRFGYEKAVALLSACGFDAFHIMTDHGLKGIKI